MDRDAKPIVIATAVRDALDRHVGLTNQPETLVARERLPEVAGAEVGVYLRLQQGGAGPSGFVDVLGYVGTELESGEDDCLRLRNETLGRLDGVRDLQLLQWRMVRPERDHEAGGLPGGGGNIAEAVRSLVIRPCLAFGVEPPRARQRLQTREGDALSRLAANAGLELFIAPIVLPHGRPGTRHEIVGRQEFPAL